MSEARKATRRIGLATRPQVAPIDGSRIIGHEQEGAQIAIASRPYEHGWADYGSESEARPNSADEYRDTITE
jgi:hypothetical protein